MRGSPHVRSAVGFCTGWRRFRAWALKRSACVARRGAARASMAPPVGSAIVKRMSLAAKRQASAEARKQRSAEATATAILNAQPVLVRAGTAIRVRGAVRAACAAAASAVVRASAATSDVAEVNSVPPCARRAQVLADVVRSPPVLAVAAARGCPRPREGGVRRAEGRRVVKAARVGDVSDTIRTVVAAQCGGEKSGRDGSAVETRFDPRFCP